jgi:hypothetical protein
MRNKTPEEWYEAVDWIYSGMQNNVGEIHGGKRIVA